jgi:hydroxyacylglutathione hydrolase
MSITKAKDGLHLIEPIAPDTYRIDEGGIANTYLVIGKKKALLIDSGLGVGNLWETVTSLTSLPVTLAVTHEHCDHAGGRDWFESYYLSRKDKGPIYRLLSSKFACKELLKMNKVKDGPTLTKKPHHAKRIYLDDGFTFDLGERTIQVISVPGHTKGSVVFLDEKEHLMFTGDDVNPYLWLQLPGCTTVTEWKPGAEKILALAETYTPYCGHSDGLIHKEQIAALIDLAGKMVTMNKEGKFKDQKKTFTYPNDDVSIPRICISKKHLR